MTDLDPVALALEPAAALGPPGRTRPAPQGGLDGFARRAGPDVVVGPRAEPAAAYAVFTVDPATNALRVRVLDGSGRLIRMIPPESVGEMIAAMNSYRR